jgi:hypothetical protein
LSQGHFYGGLASAIPKNMKMAFVGCPGIQLRHAWESEFLSLITRIIGLRGLEQMQLTD